MNEPPPVSSPSLLASKILGGFLTLISFALVDTIQVAEWLKPTCVGVLWGGIFTTGFLFGSVARGNQWFLAAAACFLFAANSALEHLTTLAPMDNLMAFSTILAAGWLTATLDPSCQVRQPHELRGLSKEQRRAGRRKLGICDLGFLTVIAACFARALPDLATGPLMLMGLFISLFTGLIISWISGRLAWSNKWQQRSALLLLAPILLAIAWILLLRPHSISLGQATYWLLAGPSSILAAQAVTVLFLLSTLRLELRRNERRLPKHLAA